MRAPHTKLLVALVAFLIGGIGLGAEHSPVRGRALLIGCTKYDHLEPSLHLQGPANDVALMRDLLCQRFGFSSEQVVSLSESTGQSELRPTRANIEREFQRLGREAIAGEQIVIFLAGHGSQQPDLNPSSDDPEPDGLDELFLPADVKVWDGGIGQVPNAIIDDELHAWLTAIERRRAAVTVIVDSCHSGTMTRGIEERVRKIPPGILVPIEGLANARQQAELVRGQNVRGQADRDNLRGSRTGEAMLDSPSVVAIYAAQSSEVTVERLLPVDGEDRKPHGLLTYTLSQILSRSSRPMTCRELVQQIQTQYVGSGRSTPTPMIEGKDRDREVFGVAVWPERSRIVLTKTARGAAINAGILHGVSQNSVLAVFPVGSDAQSKPAGHVRVQIARTIDADVVPCDVNGRPATANLPDSGRCELVYTDVGTLHLRVAITAEANSDSKWIERLKAVLQPKSPATQRPSLVRLVDSTAEADWLVRVGTRDVYLLPAEAGRSDEQDVRKSSLTSFGPLPLDPSTIEWLPSALERIARAANLKRLAANESLQGEPGDAIHIDLQIERGDTKQALASERLSFRDGERMTIRFKNPCRFPVDLTLLHIDRDCGITAVFPQQGEINRLEPGNSIPIATRVVAESRGLEHLVAIAVKSEREVIDFTCLTQPSLNAVKTRGQDNDSSLRSPLGELLKQAVFADGQTRGMKRTVVKANSVQLWSWEIQPKDNSRNVPSVP